MEGRRGVEVRMVRMVREGSGGEESGSGRWTTGRRECRLGVGCC